MCFLYVRRAIFLKNKYWFRTLCDLKQGRYRKAWFLKTYKGIGKAVLLPSLLCFALQHFLFYSVKTILLISWPLLSAWASTTWTFMISPVQPLCLPYLWIPRNPTLCFAKKFICALDHREVVFTSGSLSDFWKVYYYQSVCLSVSVSPVFLRLFLWLHSLCSSEGNSSYMVFSYCVMESYFPDILRSCFSEIPEQLHLKCILCYSSNFFS